MEYKYFESTVTDEKHQNILQESEFKTVWKLLGAKDFLLFE